MAELKDSGSRREFGTGAHRDNNAGKGRMDLVPLTVAARLLDNDTVLLATDTFAKTNDVGELIKALKESVRYIKELRDVETIILEASMQYQDGAEKYGENNWKLGVDLKALVDSGLRHYLKARRGDTDEKHYRGFAWNFIGAIWTVENIPGSRIEEIIELEPGLLYKGKDIN